MADLPNCTFIGNSAFYQCYYLSYVNLPNLLSLDSAMYAFGLCNRLASISLPSCQFLSRQPFYNCTSLSHIDLPECSAIGSYGLAYTYGLQTISLPKCTSIWNRAFYSCNNLSSVSLPVCNYLGEALFQNCYNLLSLYLMSSSICSLTNTNAFSSTPISNYTTSTGGVQGSIFVPASLYDSYKAATNWVTYADRFVSV
ncbi:MAG: leucine-rich repeat domain-containing protein [Romboutsia sp.]|nr:leucine-rich repeat domain-containing protein [Romboutsia sp.]